MLSTSKFFNLILLDESGSMQSIKQSVVKGFNETIQSIRKTAEECPDVEQYITVVSFSGHGLKTLLSNQPVQALTQLDSALYNPSSNTPLYDAMGFALTRLQTQLELMQGCHVVVTIFTDGEENASREWTAKSIRETVEMLRAKGWIFTYIGANHDVEQFAKSIAVPNTLRFLSTNEGVSAAMSLDQRSRAEQIRRVREGLPLMDDYFQSGQ